MPQEFGIRTLWLPLSKPWLAWASAAVVALLFLASMARGLSFFDSPLLAMASLQWGLAHPPGQPLYTIVGALFARLFGIDPLVGLNALSAISGALTVLPAMSLSEGMLRLEKNERALWAHVVIACALVIGASHVAIWEQSTRVEVYALAAFLGLWCLARLRFLLLTTPRKAAPFLGLGIAVGLTASTNPVLAAFAVVSGVPAALTKLANKTLRVSDVLALGAGGLLGLVPYVYVFWAGKRTDVLVWGTPRDLGTLLHYFTGKDFTTNLEVSTDQWITQFFSWIAWSYETALLPILALGITGQLVSPPQGLGRFSALTAFVLAALYLSHYAVFKPDVPDLISYASLATWLGLSGLAGLCGTLYARGQRAFAWPLLTIPLVCSLLSPPSPLARTRAAEDTARLLSEYILKAAPKNAILVLSADHWVAPVMYLQEVERQRPDIVVLATGLLGSSWHWERIYRTHRDLVPFPIRGPGGRIGRARRFLDANRERVVWIETRDFALAAGLSTCVGELALVARGSCEAQAPSRFAKFLKARVDRVGDGEPSSLGALSEVGMQLAEHAWRGGDTTRALSLLLATVPSHWDETLSDMPDVRNAPALTASLPVWQEPKPLGDPARNLYLAGQLALSAGAFEPAIRWIGLSEQHGLPEAAAWLSAMQDAATDAKPR